MNKTDYKLPERLLKNIERVKQDALHKTIFEDKEFYGVLEDEDDTFHYIGQEVANIDPLEDYVRRHIYGSNFPYLAEDLVLKGVRFSARPAKTIICLKDEIIEQIKNI